MATGSTVRYEGGADGVIEIVLDRPDRLNAISAQLLVDLRQAFERARDDDAARAILLRGEGRAFCAGQDLSERDPALHAWPFDLERIQREAYHPALRAIAGSGKPVVAAVQGIAAGAGIGLALACDMVLMGAGARLSFAFSRLGLSSDAACAWHLVKALGPSRARGLLMMAGTLGAAEAEASALIWRRVDDAALLEEAREVARQFAVGPRRALSLIREAVEAAGALGFDDYLATEARLQGIAGRSADYREGITAFLQKRPPRWE
jgi:2-(1,2-epoxy-1,2-dihydrophenyl)acetyl-CoA isomerase